MIQLERATNYPFSSELIRNQTIFYMKYEMCKMNVFVFLLVDFKDFVRLKFPNSVSISLKLQCCYLPKPINPINPINSLL